MDLTEVPEDELYNEIDRRHLKKIEQQIRFEYHVISRHPKGADLKPAVFDTWYEAKDALPRLMDPDNGTLPWGPLSIEVRYVLDR